jgi:hypothetical protein
LFWELLNKHSRLLAIPLDVAELLEANAGWLDDVTSTAELLLRISLEVTDELLGTTTAELLATGALLLVATGALLLATGALLDSASELLAMI